MMVLKGCMYSHRQMHHGNAQTLTKWCTMRHAAHMPTVPRNICSSLAAMTHWMCFLKFKTFFLPHVIKVYVERYVFLGVYAYPSLQIPTRKNPPRKSRRPVTNFVLTAGKTKAGRNAPHQRDDHRVCNRSHLIINHNTW